MLGLPPRSVFFKLFGTFFLVVALVLAAETALATRVGRGAIEGLVYDSLRTEARDGFGDVEQYLADRAHEVRSWSALSLMDDVLIDDRLLHIENLLLELRKERGQYFHAFTVTDRRGQVVASTSVGAIGTHVGVEGTTPFFPGEAIRWGGVPADETERATGLVLAQPIVSRLRTEPIGWLLAYVAWEPIDRLLDPENLMSRELLPPRFLLLVDEGGRVLAGGGSRILRVPWDRSAGPSPQEFLSARFRSSGGVIDPDVRMDVIALWSRSNALAVETAYVGTVLAAAAVGLVLAAGASFVVSRGIRARLRNLNLGATRLARGELHHRIEEGPNDEFGSVARSFNAMAGVVEQSRDELEAAVARWRTLVAHAPDIITTVDREGRILSINQVLSGYNMDDVIGAHVYDFVSQRDHHRLATAVERVFATGEGTSVEVEGGGADGGTASYSSRIGPVRRDGQVVAAVMISTDVTQRRRLEREVLETSDRERARIGQDLHDGLGQALTGVALLSKGLYAKLAGRGVSEAGDARRIAELVENAIGQTRDLAKGLFPVALDAEGLRGALEALATTVEQLFGVDCRFESDPTVDVRDRTKATHLYRIAQEAVSNALRHGHARHVAIQLTHGDAGFELTVRDDGTGLPATPHEETGMGLRSMRYRAGVLGGTFEIVSVPGGGTVMTCRVR